MSKNHRQLKRHVYKHNSNAKTARGTAFIAIVVIPLLLYVGSRLPKPGPDIVLSILMLIVAWTIWTFYRLGKPKQHSRHGEAARRKAIILQSKEEQA